MLHRRSFLWMLPAMAIGGACQNDDTAEENLGSNTFTPTAPSQTTPGSTPCTSPTPQTTCQGPGSAFDIIEYRVSGSIPQAVIRFSNSIDGLSQVITTLPYSHQLRTNALSLFVSLDARPQMNFIPYVQQYEYYQYLPGDQMQWVHAAIFINGLLFREAFREIATFSIQNLLLQVSGTYRRGQYLGE